MSILHRLLPEKIRALIPQIEALLSDKAIVDDLVIVATEVEKEINNAAKNPGADKKLRNAFNDAASIVNAGKTYIKTGSLSMMTAGKLIASKGRMKDSVHTLAEDFKAKQPVSVAFAEALKKNNYFIGAIKRLVSKTQGKLFQLEEGEDGQGYAVELLTGNHIKVLLSKEDYAEIKKTILDTPPTTPPAAPKPPCP